MTILHNQKKLQSSTLEETVPEAIEVKVESEMVIKEEPIIVYEGDPGAEFLEEEYLEEFEVLEHYKEEAANENAENEQESLLVRLESPKKKTKVETSKTETPPTGLKKNQCDICFKILTSSRLRAHKETVHLKMKRYFCDDCGKGFYFKYEIRFCKDH